MMSKPRITWLSIGLFAFGVGTSLTSQALPQNCNSCYANYNRCITATGNYDFCEHQLIACEAVCGP